MWPVVYAGESLGRFLFERGALWKREKKRKNNNIYVIHCTKMEIDHTLVKLLLNIASRKIDYFTKKYDFKVDDDDQILVEDIFDFMSKFHEFELIRKENNQGVEAFAKNKTH